MEAEDDGFYFFNDDADTTQKEHAPNQRPTTAVLGVGVPLAAGLGMSSDYISAFFDDEDDDLFGGPNGVATEPHHNKLQKPPLSRSAAYAPTHARAAALGQQQGLNNPNLSDLSSSSLDDGAGGSSDGTTPPPQTTHNSTGASWWTYARRMALIWAVLSAVLVVILVFGVKTFDASTSGVMLLSLLLDVLLVQTAYAAAMTFYTSMSTVHRGGGGATSMTPPSSAASSSIDSNLKTKSDGSLTNSTAAPPSSATKKHRKLPLVPAPTKQVGRSSKR